MEEFSNSCRNLACATTTRERTIINELSITASDDLGCAHHTTSAESRNLLLITRSFLIRSCDYPRESLHWETLHHPRVGEHDQQCTQDAFFSVWSTCLKNAPKVVCGLTLVWGHPECFRNDPLAQSWTMTWSKTNSPHICGKE